MTTLVGLVLFLGSTQTYADRATARDLLRQGQLLAGQGESLEALVRYEQAIQSDPDYTQAYELALPLWLRLGKTSRARQELEHLTLRCPECGFAWYALGVLYRRAERYDLAEQAYQVYLARHPQDPDALFGLAMALEASEDSRALPIFKRYVALEHRESREPYRQEALRRIAEDAPLVPPAAQKLLAYWSTLWPRVRSWIAIL